MERSRPRFVLIAPEVNKVARALREPGAQVTKADSSAYAAAVPIGAVVTAAPQRGQ